jgi:signal transduction histidine kinase
LLGGALAAGLAWVGAWAFAEARETAARAASLATAERAARAARALLQPSLETAHEALAALEARQAAMARADRAAQASTERSLAEALRRDGLQLVALTDSAGRVAWASHATLQGTMLADREAFAAHRAGRAEPLLTPALLDLPGGPRSLLLTRPLGDARGGFAGIALVALDPRRLDQVLAQAALLPGLHFSLLRAEGSPVARSGPGPHLPWPLARREAGWWAEAPGHALATAPLPGGELTLLAAFEDAAAAARDAGLLAYAVAGLLSLAALGLPWLTRRRPAAPSDARALDEALPAIGYRGLIEPGSGLRLTEIGAGVERLTGWTAEAALRPGWRARGMDPATLPLGPDLPDRLRHEVQASAEYRFRRADGGWMWLRETARVLGRGPAGSEIAGALEDISAERELGLQAAAAAKFATLGEMAAGLAHELNQPIAIMALAAENAAEALESGEDGVSDALARLRRIMAQADRAKAIVTQLRAFSRVDVATLEAVDLGAAVQGMMVLAGQALRDAEVQVQLRLPDVLPPVVGQSILVEQVLLNLALNARDALLERPPERRRLRIEAEPGPAAEEVTLRVIDSGPGFTPEVLERLFEPFYTTKAPGLGTGLGLSISRTIMRGLAGRISAANAADGETGAVFALVFRRAALPLQGAAEPHAAAPAPRWPAATSG